MDVVTAFLNAPLEEEIYLRVPEAFTPQPGKVIRLLKSLYGLRQAPRCWNKTLQEYLISRGLQQSQVDHGLYFIPNKLWIAVWVDDFLIMARDKQLMQDFKLGISISLTLLAFLPGRFLRSPSLSWTMQPFRTSTSPQACRCILAAVVL